MPLPELPQALGSERTLAIAWPNILLCFEVDMIGFKKEIHARKSEEAFINALAMLQPIFGNAEAMINAIRSNAVRLPEGAEVQYFFRFAGRWKAHEEMQARIAAESGGAKRELGRPSYHTEGATAISLHKTTMYNAAPTKSGIRKKDDRLASCRLSSVGRAPHL